MLVELFNAATNHKGNIEFKLSSDKSVSTWEKYGL